MVDPSFQGIERMTRGALYSEVRNGDDMSEMEIRDAFGFTKTKPIVFKERGEDGQTIKTLSVSSMKLIRLDTDGKMGSLAITLEDGRELRICSAYLKEMQAARFTFETKVDDEE